MYKRETAPRDERPLGNCNDDFPHVSEQLLALFLLLGLLRGPFRSIEIDVENR